MGATMVVKGKILTAVGGDPFDSTRKMALWSVVPAEKADSYRKVTAEYVAAGIMERKYCFPNAFLLTHSLDISNVSGPSIFTVNAIALLLPYNGDEEGIGTFTLVIKQKKDKISTVSVEGG